MSSERADIDVHKSLATGTLHDGTAEIWRGWSGGVERNIDFEAQVFAGGSLDLGCFVRCASTDLYAVVNARWRLLQDNPKGQFMKWQRAARRLSPIRLAVFPSLCSVPLLSKGSRDKPAHRNRRRRSHGQEQWDA